jgi:hypothetical protein
VGNAAEVAGEHHGATEELRDREVHHVGAILGVVLAGLGGGGAERLATDCVLAAAGSGVGWFT